MKKILVTIDFSDNSFNAALYAMELAKYFESTIFLFNVYHIPNLLIPSLPIEIIITPDELKSDTESRLKKVKKELLSKKPFDVKIECSSKNGYSEKEIVQTAIYENVDLIVMGMLGGGLREKIIGSVATSVMASTQKPVLLIPHHAEFKKPLHFVFASDAKGLLGSDDKELLLKTVNKFASEIKIVHIDSGALRDDRIKIEKQFNKIFESVSHSYHFLNADEIDESLHQFININNTDVVVMIYREHTLFEKIFRQSHTRKLAFYTHIPLLILHSANDII